MYHCLDENAKLRKQPPTSFLLLDDRLREGIDSKFQQAIELDDAAALEEALEEESSKCGGNREFRALAIRIFHLACARDAMNCCDLLLRPGCAAIAATPINSIDAVNGSTGLHIASMQHSKSCIEFLLKLGANVSIKSRRGKLPLEEAVGSVVLLIQWDAETPAAVIVQRMAAKDLSSLRVLVQACKEQLPSVALKLVNGSKLSGLLALLLAASSTSLINTLIKSDRDAGSIVDHLLSKLVSASSSEWGATPMIHPPIGLISVSAKGAAPTSSRSPSSSKASATTVARNMKRSSKAAVVTPLAAASSSKAVAVTPLAAASSSKAVAATPSAAAASSKAVAVTPSAAASRQAATSLLTRDKAAAATSQTDQAPCATEDNLTAAIKLLECVLLLNPRLSVHPHSSFLAPLIRVAQANNARLVQLLLNSGASVNESDQFGNTALHWLLRQATPLNGRSVDLEAVKSLLDAGAKVTLGNKVGATVVHTAAGHGHVEALALILDRDPPSVNVVNVARETPLHYAVANSHPKCAALLLKHGANRLVSNQRNLKPNQMCNSREIQALLSLDDKVIKEHSWEHLLTLAVQSHANIAEAPPPFVPQPSIAEHKVFIGGLPLFITSKNLKEILQHEFGLVSEAVILKSNVGTCSTSRGFGFAVFINPEDAARALDRRFMAVAGKLVEIKSYTSKQASIRESSSFFISSPANVSAAPSICSAPGRLQSSAPVLSPLAPYTNAWTAPPAPIVSNDDQLVSNFSPSSLSPPPAAAAKSCEEQEFDELLFMLQIGRAAAA